MAQITAQDVEKVKFSKPPIGKRGYNEDEVDAFLDAVQESLGDYEGALHDLDEELQDVRRIMRDQSEPIQMPLPPAPPPPAVEPPSAQAARILELAENTAQQLTDESEATAARVVRDAEAKAAQTLSEARNEAAKITDEARRASEVLDHKIAELRDFEKNYRARLDSYMSAQLEALRADGVVEPH